METFYAHMEVVEEKEFQSNLRGMETVVAFFRFDNLCAFQSNLRGMETYRQGNYDKNHHTVSIEP